MATLECRSLNCISYRYMFLDIFFFNLSESFISSHSMSIISLVSHLSAISCSILELYLTVLL